MRTQVILNPIGSGGDVFPFLALGQELQRRKHHVAIMTNPVYQQDVGTAGLEFIPLGSDSDMQQLGQRDEIRHRQSAWKVALQWGAVGTMRQAARYLKERKERCPTLLVNSPLGFGSRIAAEAFDLPLATIVMSPFTLRSAHEAPVIRPMWLGSNIPAIAKRIQYWLADHLFIDPVIRKEVNQLQSEFGLKPTRRFFHRWCFSASLCIGAFPTFFAPTQPDWPQNFHSTGNFKWERPANSDNETRLSEFLQPEDKFVIATAGSAGANSPQFYQHWLQAAKAQNLKVVILEPNPAIVPDPLPDHAIWLKYHPLTKLLPNASAIVHTGGVGVTLLSLRFRVPQVVLPMVNDQFDNANRVKHLAAGQVLALNTLSKDQASSALSKALQLKPDAFDFAEPDKPIQTACDLLESIFHSH